MKKPFGTLATLLILLIMLLVPLSLSGCADPFGTQAPTGTQSPTRAQSPTGTQNAAGAGISSARINESGHLVLTLSDGRTLDAGSVIGPKGPVGSISFAELVPVVEQSIVRIDVTVRNGIASGSGTIVDKRGYITTNAHVVSGGQSIQVTLKDGTILAASVIAEDAKQDLAIIRLDSPRTDFPVMALGAASDIRVGDPVMAVGFPAGKSLPGPATFTAGVVSAIRNFQGMDFVQTDTPVNPGNSGGCLFTLGGKMIGIPSEGITPANQDFEEINLAIHIDKVRAFMQQNIK